MSITGGFFESGASAPDINFMGIGAQFEAAGCLDAADPEECFRTAVASGSIADPAGGKAPQLQNLIDGCAAGNPGGLACTELLKERVAAGLGCDTAAIEGLYPGGIVCDCATETCTPTGVAQQKGIPMWAWYAAAGAVGLLLWTRRR